jgi:hypothetical protein
MWYALYPSLHSSIIRSLRVSKASKSFDARFCKVQRMKIDIRTETKKNMKP